MDKDLVNHPAHYTNGSIECIDAIRASMTAEQFIGYCKGNALKYLWRFQYKNEPIEDCNKAIWYLKKIIETMEKEYYAQ